jgi:calcium/calmodulin-dependent protein kinase I
MYRIITYVLLCGYSPFRSEDNKELIRETTQAKIEFHERYWKNVSPQAKEFIKTLLNPDPSKRPTVAEAFGDTVRSPPPPLLTRLVDLFFDCVVADDL